MKEDNSIAGFKKIFCRGSSTSASGEVVNEPHSLIFKRNSGPARCDEDDAVIQTVVLVDECLCQSGVGWQAFRGRVAVKVVILEGIFSGRRLVGRRHDR